MASLTLGEFRLRCTANRRATSFTYNSHACVMSISPILAPSKLSEKCISALNSATALDIDYSGSCMIRAVFKVKRGNLKHIVFSWRCMPGHTQQGTSNSFKSLKIWQNCINYSTENWVSIGLDKGLAVYRCQAFTLNQCWFVILDSIEQYPIHTTRMQIFSCKKYLTLTPCPLSWPPVSWPWLSCLWPHVLW